MKKVFILLLLCLPLVDGIAQDKKYKTLLKDMNSMLKNAEEFNYIFEPDFKIVQPYQIKEGILSVIIKGKANDEPLTRKYEAPITDIKDFVMDIYYVLSFRSESVVISDLSDGQWKETGRLDYFHIGRARESETHKWSGRFREELNNLFPDLENEYEWMD